MCGGFDPLRRCRPKMRSISGMRRKTRPQAIQSVETAGFDRLNQKNLATSSREYSAVSSMSPKLMTSPA